MSDPILTYENFEPYLGTDFVFVDADLPATTLTLAEARAKPAYAAPEAVRVPFSLLFRSADPHVLSQRLYRLRHDALGELEIFLVPIGQGAEGVEYGATFN